jgi:hypothetical protein
VTPWDLLVNLLAAAVNIETLLTPGTGRPSVKTERETSERERERETTSTRHRDFPLLPRPSYYYKPRAPPARYLQLFLITIFVIFLIIFIFNCNIHVICLGNLLSKLRLSGLHLATPTSW